MSTIAPIWVTARAAGIGALLAASLAATLGLLSALKPAWTKRHRVEITSAHEALSLSTMALLVVHGLAIALDPVVKAGLFGTLVPFAGPYRPFAVGLGQLAGYGMVALGLGYYVKRHIGAKRWRSAHRFVSVFWLMGVAHGVLTGTDATAWWFLVSVGLPVLAGVALLIERWFPEDAEPARAPGL